MKFLLLALAALVAYLVIVWWSLRVTGEPDPMSEPFGDC